MERLIVLGCGSALPASGRNPSAQILEHNSKYFLIDCGEGTQSRLRASKISFEKISHIFISHLHGDHYLGLQGLLSSMSLLGRKQKLELYGPPELWDIISLQNKLSYTQYNFQLTFHPVTQEELLLESGGIKVESIKLNHGIPTYGYLFQELPKPRQILGKVCKDIGVPHFLMNSLRAGRDYINENGEVFKNEILTKAPKKSWSYVYCSDNRVKGDLASRLMGVDVLYHEATFLHKELAKAKKTNHTTCKEAAELAKKAQVGKLILGHYSARYKTLEGYLEEALPIFSNTILSNEGDEFFFD